MFVVFAPFRKNISIQYIYIYAIECCVNGSAIKWIVTQIEAHFICSEINCCVENDLSLWFGWNAECTQSSAHSEQKCAPISSFHLLNVNWASTICHQQDDVKQTSLENCRFFNINFNFHSSNCENRLKRTNFGRFLLGIHVDCFGRCFSKTDFLMFDMCLQLQVSPIIECRNLIII